MMIYDVCWVDLGGESWGVGRGDDGEFWGYMVLEEQMGNSIGYLSEKLMEIQTGERYCWNEHAATNRGKILYYGIWKDIGMNSSK